MDPQNELRTEFNLEQIQILKLIASGASLHDVLERIVLLIEKYSDGVCSILLLHQESSTLTTGAAPHLPKPYSEAIENSKIGPEEGSCGSSAYRHERVIVPDIATHPYWRNFRHLALPYGLRACWSSPIFSPEHQVLGTFAVYYFETRAPQAFEMELVDSATHLASIALTKEQNDLKLVKSEARYRQILETSYEGIMTLDLSGCLTYANARALAMSGYELSELLGQSVLHLLDDLTRQEVAAVFSKKRALVSGQNEVLLKTKTDKDLWVIITSSPIRDESGKITGILAMLTDITRRKKIEERIKSSEALSSLIFNGVNDVLFYLAVESDRQFRFVKANDSFFRVTGLQRENVIGKTVDEVIPEPSLSTVLEKYSQAARARSVCKWDEISDYPNGKKYGEVTIAPILDSSNQCTGLIGVVHDITERKQLDEKIASAQRMESLGTLAGGIAHDFNNLLTAIVGNINLARRYIPADHKAQRNLGVASSACKRAEDLVSRILSFSSSRENKRKMVHIESLVEETLQFLRSSLPAMIELENHSSPGIPSILADASQIHQVLLNLGTNAALAMGEHGKLKFELDTVTFPTSLRTETLELKPGTYVRLSVADTGHGIEPATLKRIFEPFFTTRPLGQGTGLGLFVVHRIVKEHQGGIVVTSQIGIGTKFELYFPAATESVSLEKSPLTVAFNPQAQGERILFIDDEEAIVDFAKPLLEDLGYRVTCYTSPLEALKKFEKEYSGFDAVITDLSMPSISGLELAREIMRIRPSIPIVLISGYLRPADIESARRLGIREILRKPSSIDEISSALRRLLSASSRQENFPSTP